MYNVDQFKSFKLKTLLNKFVKLLLKIPILVWIILTIELSFIPLLNFQDPNIYSNTILFCLDIIKIILELTIISLLIIIVFSKWKKISCVLCIIYIYVYTLLLLYHYYAGSTLDFQFLWKFRNDLLTADVIKMIRNFIGLHTVLFLILFLLILIGIQIKWKLFSNYQEFRNQFLKCTILSLIFISLQILPIKSLNEITYFAISVRNWYRIQTVFSDIKYENIKDFPYIKPVKKTTSTIDHKYLPNIFIIAVESFNANFVERKTITGKRIMPFFDSLIQRGIYIKDFYGNSVLTDKGHLAILFSILPSFRKTIFEDYASNNFQSLAKIFKNLDYKTIFFQGFSTKSLKFGNEGPFLFRNGFQICKGTDCICNKYKKYYTLITPYNKSGFGGFKDCVMYQNFFDTLDSLYQNSKNKKMTFFGFLATISSHRPWLSEMGNKDLPYSYPNKVEEDYANALFMVDCYLRVFFNELNQREYLNNSIIIITGDHSTPMNEHGNISRSSGCYEESFRTPLLMIWKNHLEPIRIQNQAWSQIDIAPTLLDLLNIKTANHFMGRSFLKKNQLQNNIIYLIQPVDGLYLCMVNLPYKYVLHVSTKQEYLYDLNNDPLEQNNLAEKSIVLDKLSYFHNKSSLFGLNEYLLENNRIWYDKINFKH